MDGKRRIVRAELPPPPMKPKKEKLRNEAHKAPDSDRQQGDAKKGGVEGVPVNFKLIVEKKNLDNELTPLPPSYPSTMMEINTDALRVNWGVLTPHKQMQIRDKIIGTRLRKWRNEQVKKNRLLYHTKRNGVGIIQGFCECIDEGSHPCKIMKDLLDITDEELEIWKKQGTWPWTPIPTPNSKHVQTNKLTKSPKLKRLDKLKASRNKPLIVLHEARPEMWTRLLPPPLANKGEWV